MNNPNRRKLFNKKMSSNFYPYSSIFTVTPKFSVVPKNPSEVSEGKTLMIDCKAYGDPLPTIQWDKNNIMNGFDRDR